MSNERNKDEEQEEGKRKEESLKDKSMNKLLYSYPLGTKLKQGTRRRR